MSDSVLAGSILALILLLVGASAFFSGTETSIMTANRIRIRRLAEKGDARAKRVLNAVEHSERTITTILIGNNIVNISASALATFLAMRFFGDVGVAVATGIMTFVLLLFGEIMPKMLGAKHPEYIALRVAGPLELVGRFFSPIVKFFGFITGHIIKRMVGSPSRTRTPFITEDEIKMVARIGASEGVIEEHEREMIHNVFAFTDKRASDVMHHRGRIVAIEGGECLQKAVALFRKHGYSSMPVYRQRFDNIIGILSVKDILRFEQVELARVKAEELVKPVVVVSDRKRVPHILEEMQDRGINMAIALDDDKKVSGILSIEDVLEEIVGDLHKEMDGEAYPHGG